MELLTRFAYWLAAGEIRVPVPHLLLALFALGVIFGWWLRSRRAAGDLRELARLKQIVVSERQMPPGATMIVGHADAQQFMATYRACF